jgi:hypothetical protein
MFVIVAGRGAGKTTALVDWFFEHPGYRGIIVANDSIKRNMVRELARKAAQLGFERCTPKWLTPFVVSARDFAMHGWLRGHQARQWAIDDADQVLQTMFGVEIDYVAMNATLVPRIVGAQIFDESHSWKAPSGDHVDGETIEVEGVQRATTPHRALPAYKNPARDLEFRPRRDNGLDV